MYAKLKEIKIVFTDIDDTIYSPKHGVSKRSLETFSKLQDKGIIFVPITGRPLMNLKMRPKDFGSKTYVSGYNGAITYDLQTNTNLYSDALDLANIPAIIDELITQGIDFVSYDEENSQLYTNNRHNKYAQIESDHCHLPLEEKNIDFLKQNVTHKILGLPDPELGQQMVEHFSKLFGHNFSIVLSKPFFLEINRLNISKAYGVQKICDELGLSIDQALCFGDSMNDLEMLKYAPNSVAVANARDEVKAVCNYHTASCSDDGVAKFIEEHLL